MNGLLKCWEDWRDHKFIGYFAMVVTISIWASFALSTRAAARSNFEIGDIIFMRSIVPFVLLCPFIPARLSKIRHCKIDHLLFMSIGAGLPFFFIAYWGASLTSAAHFSALIPGLTPVFVAIVSWWLLRACYSKMQVFSGVLIVAAAILFVATASNQASSFGSFLLLVSSVLWALYTVFVKRSGLDAISIVIVVSFSSMILMVFCLLCGLITVSIERFASGDAIAHILIQGVFASVVSNLLYAFAIWRVGVKNCSCLAALTPALSALFAAHILGESLSYYAAGAIGLLILSIILFNLGKVNDG